MYQFCIFSVFIIVRHTSRSTLFPYTTLFRSQGFQISVGTNGTFDRNAQRLQPVTTQPRLAAHSHQQVIKDKRVLVDRKSTRLNSSHVAISYAVFCLKKTS